MPFHGDANHIPTIVFPILLPDVSRNKAAENLVTVSIICKPALFSRDISLIDNSSPNTSSSSSCREILKHMGVMLAL